MRGLWQFADMDTLQEIHIIDLLCQREAELVKVACAEEAVRNLLGGVAFPFPPPPDLPSRRKTRMVKKAAVAVRLPEKLPAGLRMLELPGENAYRVVYRYNGEQKESFQADFDFLNLLLNFPEDAFQVLSIEAVFFRGPEDWQSRAMLWQVAAQGKSAD